MSKISVKIPVKNKKSFDILKKTFDPKYRGQWVPTEDNLDIFLNIYVKEKYKQDLFFLDFFSIYSINIPSKKEHKLLVRDSRQPTGSIRPSITKETVKTELSPYINAYKKSKKPFHFFDIKMIAENTNTKEIDYHSSSAIYDKASNRVDFFNTQMSFFNIKAFDKQFNIFFKAIYGDSVRIKYTLQCHRLAIEEFYNSCDIIYKNPNFYIHGPCAIWTIWFLDTRLTNKHLSHREVLDKALTYFRKRIKYQAICKVIRDYGVFIDKIIKKYRLIGDSGNIQIVYKETPQNNRILQFILGGLSFIVFTGLAYRKLKNNSQQGEKQNNI